MVPVILVDLPPEQLQVLDLARYKIFVSWDEQLPARLPVDFQAAPDMDPSLSSYREDEIEKPFKSPGTWDRQNRPESFDLEAALEQAQPESRTQPCHLWLLGEHRVPCGDVTKPEDVERLLGGPVALVADPTALTRQARLGAVQTGEQFGQGDPEVAGPLAVRASSRVARCSARSCASSPTP